MNKIAYSVSELCELAGIGRTTIYSAVGAGTLKARKIGRRTIFLHDDVIAFLHALPTSSPASEHVDG
jgi:excisionase family DNA binding protein